MVNELELINTKQKLIIFLYKYCESISEWMDIKAKLDWCGCQAGRSPKLDIEEGSRESFCYVQLWGFA